MSAKYLLGDGGLTVCRAHLEWGAEAIMLEVQSCETVRRCPPPAACHPAQRPTNIPQTHHLVQAPFTWS